MPESGIIKPLGTEIGQYCASLSDERLENICAEIRDLQAFGVVPSHGHFMTAAMEIQALMGWIGPILPVTEHAICFEAKRRRHNQSVLSKGDYTHG